MEARSALLSRFLPATLDVSVSCVPPLFGPDTISRSFVRQMRVGKEERLARVVGIERDSGLDTGGERHLKEWKGDRGESPRQLK